MSIKKIAAPLTIAASLLLTSTAWADAGCKVPTQDGNTWTLQCSEDGRGDSDYICSYRITVKNTDGKSDTIEASGTVAKNAKDVVIWSAIEHGGSAIVSAEIDRGSCDPQ